MKIRSIEIKGLFDNFDYVIDFPLDRDILILTGPNGYGKTHILNIIYNLFHRKMWFFLELEFQKIILILSNNITLIIEKHSIPEEANTLIIKLISKKEIVETTNYEFEADERSIRHLGRYIQEPLKYIGEGSVLNIRSKEVTTVDDIFEQYRYTLPNSIIQQFSSGTIGERTKEVLEKVDVHLIQEQRLFQKVVNIEKAHRSESDRTTMTRAIQNYADDLKSRIDIVIEESFTLSQDLDSSYPSRLVNENNKISETDYQKRFANLLNKQEKLTKNNLYKYKQEVLSYNESDAKALLIYLNDLEKKLNVFDELLEKLELFTNILNQRRFTFKSIHIDRELGFIFKSDKDVKLDLHQLSSGEQHEVVLLYELIFNTQPNMVVLIDEPEISLHITWQKEFLNDLLKIIELQQFQVIIATHSPSIINDRWDLVHTLEKKEVYASK